MDRPSRTQPFIVCIVALVVLASGCSVAEFAYDNADWFVVRYSNQYMDLTSGQEKHLRARAKVALEEHRKRELPVYVELLRQFRKAVADGLTHDQGRRLIDLIEQAYRRFAQHAADLLAPTLAVLSPEQIEHLEQTLEENDRELREKYLEGDLQERLGARADRTVKATKRWTGSLYPSQIALIREWSQQLPYTTENWIDYRRQQASRLLRILRRREGETAIRAYLQAWWVRRENTPAQAQRAVEQYVDGLLRMLAAADATVTREQRSHIIERIDWMIELIESLYTPKVLPTAVEPGMLGDP